MDFGKALEQVKLGSRIARDGWDGEGMWVELQTPDENSKMGRPYLYMSPVDGALVPWVASQTDILAEDWMILLGVS